LAQKALWWLVSTESGLDVACKDNKAGSTFWDLSTTRGEGVMQLYRGLSYTRVQNIVAGREQIAATSNGEFGNGSYYWKDDLAAGILSALQYYGQQDNGWAVLSITFERGDLAGVPRGSVLNFRDPAATSRGYDPSTQTAPRDVTVPQFGDATVRMDFAEFREVNADPEGHGLTGVKNTLPWPNYAIIAGPTAAAPKDVNLTQIKFAGDGIAILNRCPKQIAVHGPKLNDSTFAIVRSWNLENRKQIYDKYIHGQTEVTLRL
jgi:hypothetical protein